MKNLKLALIPFAAACLLFTGCCKEEDQPVPMAKVNVHVNDFSISIDEYPSSKSPQDVADYTDVGAITLAFYAGNTEVYKVTQYRYDPSAYTTFGDFTCNLPIGTYTMVVIGRGYFTGDEFDITSPTSAGYTSERPRETFCTTQSVMVTASGADIGVTLNRINSGIQIVSTDGRSAGAAKIRTTYAKGSKSFNPTTGLATDDNGFSLTNTPSAAVGATIDVGSFLFLATDEETMTITLEVLDADDNVLVTKVVPNVPLQRNRKTTLTGALFNASSSSASFQLETSWLPGNTVPF